LEAPKYNCETSITGVWGWSLQSGPGVEPLVRGVKPLEAETLLAFKRLMEFIILPTFPKI